MLVGAGLAAMAVADVLFLYLSATASYTEGTLLDALWPASSLLLSFCGVGPADAQAGRRHAAGSVVLFAPGPFAAAAWRWWCSAALERPIRRLSCWPPRHSAS